MPNIAASEDAGSSKIGSTEISLYVLITLIGLYILLVGGWQVMVLKGREMKNPDGTFDDWHRQKTHYGIAVADVFFTCPVSIVGIVLVFVTPRWGILPSGPGQLLVCLG